MSFSRDEMETEFEAYQERGRIAGRTGDWNAWAEQFTLDAVYVEHLYGRFHGRDEIRSWITSTMSVYPNDQFVSFPVEWSMFDTDRGWIVCEIENRMTDPGDGSIFEASNLTRLVYAGNGQWSYEEDVYNPQSMADVFNAWLERKREIEAGRAGT